MKTPISPEVAREMVKRSQQQPPWWVKKILGNDLWSVQEEIINSVRVNQETVVASCHGAGKSYIAANTALWYLFNHRPSVVITTAPTDRQVKGILWKEIRLAHSRAKLPLGGKLLTQELKLDTNWWAWGFTAPEYDPDRFQGFHEVNILVIVDEAAGVSEQIYEAIDGVLTSEHARLLMIGNPTSTTGRFGQAFKTPGIKKFYISAFDTPNFTTFRITEKDIESGAWENKITDNLPHPYLVTPQWVAKRFQRWGKNSPLYQARVLGQFPTQGTDTLIPLDWIERAVRAELEPGEPVELGVDVARYGPDESVWLLRRGSVARIYQTRPMGDTMETAGLSISARRDTGATKIKVDADGLGAGVFDRLKELNEPALEMRSGFAASDSERFANKRAEWWWGLRERFEDGDIDIENDEEMIAQLANIKYKINSRGQIQVESKDDMKKRGLPSPDRADALMLAFAKQNEVKPIKLRAKSVGRR
ncbi:MAG: hypothetical protein QMD71_06335 [bacterium]|nr:hypothetical protein [bacterium]